MDKSVAFWGAGLLLATAVTMAPFALKAQDAKTVVEQRVALMKGTGKAMGAIAKVAKGEAAYGPETVKAAETVLANAKRIPAMFPKGSTTADSRAKPEIWEKWDDFEKHASGLQAEAAKLVQVAQAGDAAAIGAQLKATGMACGGCHKAYRKPEEKK